MVGRVLCKKYQIVRLIGRGGMGAVYEAVHCDLDKKVAVKTLLPHFSENEEAYQRFLLEARAASKLRHPHIIEVTDFDHTSDGMPFMVLEYLEGEDLSQVLSQQGRLTPGRAHAIFRDVLAAMEAAHRAGIVHRDLKPQNIFLCRYGDRDDFPKVLDFGISKVLDTTGGLTGSCAYMGTPNYMAPEQADGRSGEADARSDVFALGTILFRALGGRDAYPGNRAATVLYKIVNEEPPLLSDANPTLPEDTVEAVRRAMARDPAQRFSSAAALGEALLPTLPTEGPAAETTGGRGYGAAVATLPSGAHTKVADEDPSLASTLGQSVGEVSLPPEARPRQVPWVLVFAGLTCLILAVAAAVYWSLIGPDEPPHSAALGSPDAGPDKGPPALPPDSWTSAPDQAIKRPDAAIRKRPRPVTKRDPRPPPRNPDARIRRAPEPVEADPAGKEKKEKEVIF